MRLFRRRAAEPTAAEQAEAQAWADKLAQHEREREQSIARYREQQELAWKREEERAQNQRKALKQLPDLNNVPQCTKCGGIEYALTAERRIRAQGFWQGNEDARWSDGKAATVMAATCARCGWDLGLFRPLDVPGEGETYHTGGIVPKGEPHTLERELVRTDDGQIVCQYTPIEGEQ